VRWCASADDSGDDFGEEYGQWKPKRSFYTTKRLRHMHGELNEEDKVACRVGRRLRWSHF
jgi:hypothetical protein